MRDYDVVINNSFKVIFEEVVKYIKFKDEKQARQINDLYKELFVNFNSNFHREEGIMFSLKLLIRGARNSSSYELDREKIKGDLVSKLGKMIEIDYFSIDEIVDGICSDVIVCFIDLVSKYVSFLGGVKSSREDDSLGNRGR